MPALPLATTATAAAATEGDVKNYLTALRDYLSTLLGDSGLAADARAKLAVMSTAQDIVTALGYTPANQASVLGKDLGHNNIGSFCLVVIWGGSSASIGSTIAGSALRAAGMGYESDGYGFFATANTGAPLSGTWRLLGAFNNVSTSGSTGVRLKNPMSLAQRIS